MENFGECRCIHCHNLFEILKEYPWVGSYMYCTYCGEWMKIKGHYLEFNGMITFALSKVSDETTYKLNKMLRETL